MFSEEEIRRLKNKLPVGAVNIIEAQTDASKATIYKFLNGGQVRCYLQEQIVEVALGVIEENTKQVEKLKKRFGEVVL